MSINSNERFATIEEFWQALNAEPIAEPSVNIVPIAAAAQQVPSTHIVTKRSVTAVPKEAIRSVETRRPRRRRMLFVLLPLLALLALLSGIVFSTNYFRGSSSRQAASATAVPRPPTTTPYSSPTALPTATPKPIPSPTTASTATAQPTTPPTAQPTSQPTTAPAGLPVLGKTYNGQVTNTFVKPNETAPIQLNNIVQNNGAITSGYLYVQPGYGLEGSGNFTGSVSTNQTIQFKVQETGILPLLFTGTIRADRSMTGSYCAANPDNTCNYSQGYGNWSVNPPSA
jgi:hypothetical protein